MDEYITVGSAVIHEVLMNRSRFIGQTAMVTSEHDVEKALDEAKKRYTDASHHCFAYILDTRGILQRFSDDGEPSGTAGMPILQVLNQQGLKNSLVVVTRYFGGIKLGAGGLLRAYAKTAAETLDKAGKRKMILSTKGTIAIDYPLLGAVEYFLRMHSIPIVTTQYDERVTLTIITKEDWELFFTMLCDICHGNVLIKTKEAIYYCWDI